MAGIIHKNRNGCALHGALKAIDAIGGVVPIVHSSAGCSIQSRLSDNALSGNNGLLANGWRETPSTNLVEKHVVFGGTSRLREQIKNTVKVHNASLYVVVTGCVPEVVGDDLQAMVKEAREQGFPVIGISTPGFKGDVYHGYEILVKGILGQIEKTHKPLAQIPTGLVNILGLVPNQHLFWDGDLAAIETTLAMLGLRTNKLFGFGQGVDNWLAAQHAQLNLVVSPWGLETARYLDEKYNIPYLYFGWLPTGSHDTSWLIRLIAEKLRIGHITEQVTREEAKHRYQLQKIAGHYFKYDLQKRIAVVGETATVAGIVRFLQNTFGQIVSNVVITDSPNDEVQKEIKVLFENRENYSVDILFSNNGNEIDNLLRKSKPELILGSSLEQAAAKSLGVPFLTISSPAFEKVVLQRSYTGYQGAITLVEDITELLLSTIASETLKRDYFRSLQGSLGQQRLAGVSEVS